MQVNQWEEDIRPVYPEAVNDLIKKRGAKQSEPWKLVNKNQSRILLTEVIVKLTSANKRNVHLLRTCGKAITCQFCILTTIVVQDGLLSFEGWLDEEALREGAGFWCATRVADERHRSTIVVLARGARGCEK